MILGMEKVRPASRCPKMHVGAQDLSATRSLLQQVLGALTLMLTTWCVYWEWYRAVVGERPEAWRAAAPRAHAASASSKSITGVSCWPLGAWCALRAAVGVGVGVGAPCGAWVACGAAAVNAASAASAAVADDALCCLLGLAALSELLEGVEGCRWGESQAVGAACAWWAAPAVVGLLSLCAGAFSGRCIVSSEVRTLWGASA
jgi:hypothetical protein